MSICMCRIDRNWIVSVRPTPLYRAVKSVVRFTDDAVRLDSVPGRYSAVAQLRKRFETGKCKDAEAIRSDDLQPS
jgi:hypothetical protein